VGAVPFEEAHDDPRRGYDRNAPRRLPADPRDRALIRAAVDLPGQASLEAAASTWAEEAPKLALPFVRLWPTRCPRLDVLDVRQPAATANPFNLDPHIAAPGWILFCDRSAASSLSARAR
jgi:hypothetical protein